MLGITSTLVGSFIKVFQKPIREWERRKNVVVVIVFLFSSHIILLNEIYLQGLTLTKKSGCFADTFIIWVAIGVSWKERWTHVRVFICVCVYTCLLKVYKRIVLIAISVIENPTLALVTINKLNRHRYVFGRCSSAYMWMLSKSVCMLLWQGFIWVKLNIIHLLFKNKVVERYQNLPKSF